MGFLILFFLNSFKHEYNFLSNMKQIIFLSLMMVLVPMAFASPFNFEESLKQQINENLPKNEILCKDNSHVLVERTNGKLSCVYESTAKKFDWKLVYDEFVKENLLLQNNPAVKDCTVKGPDDAYTTYPYQNKTHNFDIGICEWSLLSER